VIGDLGMTTFSARASTMKRTLMAVTVRGADPGGVLATWLKYGSGEAYVDERPQSKHRAVTSTRIGIRRQTTNKSLKRGCRHDNMGVTSVAWQQATLARRPQARRTAGCWPSETNGNDGKRVILI